MSSTNLKNDRTTKILRWIARIIGSISVAFFLLMGIGEAVCGSDPWTWESLMVVSFAIILTAGVLISWWKERIGGVILICAAVAFAVFIFFSAGRNKVLASTLISLPFLVSGVVFFIVGHNKSKVSTDE